MWKFDNLLDTPDIELKEGEILSITYSYFWGTTFRTKTDYILLPKQIHMKDLIKHKQNALRKAYTKHQSVLGGERPTLVNIVIV